MPSQETIQRALGNLTQPERLKKPLIAAFYLTFSCNAECDFCSQGEYTHGDKADEYKADVDTEQQLAVLRTIRQDVPNIYFLGGEPTAHPGFQRIMEESTALDFDTIAVNTNGILYKPEIAKHANLIVASLHTTDPKKIANIYKTSPEQGEKVLDNIERYANERNRDSSEMAINCVVTGDNINDVYQVAELCKRLGIKLNISPAIKSSGHPDESLIGNPDYISLIQWAMGQNGLVPSSKQYLKTIQHFYAFRCMPHIIPAIYPNGDMAVPCPNIQDGPELVNIMKTGGVNKGLLIGRDRFERKNGVLDTRIRCAELCHKACYIEGAGISTMQGIIGRLRGDALRVYKSLM